MRQLLGLPLAVAALALAGLATGCDDQTDRFEDVAKLRALGVAVTPVVTSPAASGTGTWTLQAYVAVPTGAAVTSAVAYDDPTDPETDQRATLTVDAASVGNAANCEAHQAFNICHVTATAPIPAAGDVVIPADVGYGRLHYGLKIIAGGQEQDIVGSLLVFPVGSPQLATTVPKVAITTPAANAAVSGQPPLNATLTTSPNENFRVGWYASGGAIDNRRAEATSWSGLPGAGPATLLVTARCLATGAFAYSAIDVTVQ
jgi:hypothetical protein